MGGVLRGLVVAAIALLLVACSGDDGDQRADEGGGDEAAAAEAEGSEGPGGTGGTDGTDGAGGEERATPAGPRPAGADEPRLPEALETDACALLTFEEVTELTGYSVEEGEELVRTEPTEQRYGTCFYRHGGGIWPISYEVHVPRERVEGMVRIAFDDEEAEPVDGVGEQAVVLGSEGHVTVADAYLRVSCQAEEGECDLVAVLARLAERYAELASGSPPR